MAPEDKDKGQRVESKSEDGETGMTDVTCEVASQLNQIQDRSVVRDWEMLRLGNVLFEGSHVASISAFGSVVNSGIGTEETGPCLHTDQVGGGWN
jgi:magnesium-transporting ATPase (P-type)